MTDFIYDKQISDSVGLKLEVTVVDVYSDIMITLHGGPLRIPFFLTPDNATKLATVLINAVCAHDDAVAKSSETISD